MGFSTDWLAEILPDYQGAVDLGIEIRDVEQNPAHSMKKGLYIPLDKKGDHADLLKEAISNGAIAAIWDKLTPVPAFLPTDFPLFFVDHLQSSLNEVTEAYLEEVNPCTVFVTGDEGVDMTQNCLSSVLSQQFEVYEVNWTESSDEELFLQLLQMPSDTEMFVLGVELDGVVDLQDLVELVKLDFGVISHVSSNGHSEDLIQKSVEIFAGLKENSYVLLDGDDPLFSALFSKENVLTCGFKEKNKEVIIDSEEESFMVNTCSYHHHNVDKSLLKYLGFAVVIGERIGLDQASIQTGLTNTHYYQTNLSTPTIQK
ncbi:Mur ligase family protein [Pontibacillus marinus]|uniref:Mur ligase central domain-containing protein n=1 Tax=Pontibacillus marinus BH030004 = DSM 16465 TaxID=1385511 RepID=A0A0A5FSJ2_9BACI|nr:Mur ligase family protein [Pontibacillus marinus]KGX83756.1 hypothetical protein N783_21740 [Pontibacillus marinus BH030004 = DSM 16465]